jgi:Fe-S-cluster formation regulator IscX/YfhJ
LTLINPQPRHVFRTLHWLSTMTNSEEKLLHAVSATWIDEADYPAAY